MGRSSGEGKGYPFQYSVLENSMVYPQGSKESDMTEQLSLNTYLEGFCEEKACKMILETTGHQSGESVIQAEETNAKTLDLRYFKNF